MLNNYLKFIYVLTLPFFLSCNSQTVKCNNRNDITEEVIKSFDAEKINYEFKAKSKSPVYIDQYNYNTDGNLAVYQGSSLIDDIDMKTIIEYQYSDYQLSEEVRSKYYDDELIEELSETLTVEEYDYNQKPILIKNKKGSIKKSFTYQNCLESTQTIYDIKKDKVIKFKKLKYDDNGNLISLNTTYYYGDKIIEKMVFVNYKYNENEDWIYRVIKRDDDTYLIENREITYR